MIDQLFQFLTRNLILPNGWYLDESDHNFTITLLATTNNVIHAPNRNNLTLIVLLLKALFLHRDFFTLTKTFIITIIFWCLYNSFLPFPLGFALRAMRSLICVCTENFGKQATLAVVQILIVFGLFK